MRTEFCKKNEFFEWEKHPNGEYVISSKDSVKIKRKLMQKHLNRGLPEIKLIDPNHKNKGYYLLEHTWDGRVIYQPYVGEVLSAIFILTGKPVVLTTKNKNNEDKNWRQGTITYLNFEGGFYGIIDDNKKISKIAEGGTLAAPLWAKFMKKAVDKTKKEDLPVPVGSQRKNFAPPDDLENAIYHSRRKIREQLRNAKPEVIIWQ